MVGQSRNRLSLTKWSAKVDQSRPNKEASVKTGSIEFIGAESDDLWNEQPGHRSAKANYINYKESVRISRQPAKPFIKSSLSPPPVMGPTHRRPPWWENRGRLVGPCWARYGCQGQFKGRSHQGYNSQWLRAVISKLQLSAEWVNLRFSWITIIVEEWFKKTLDLYY